MARPDFDPAADYKDVVDNPDLTHDHLTASGGPRRRPDRLTESDNGGAPDEEGVSD